MGSKPLTIESIDGELRISIGVEVLKYAAEHSQDDRLCWPEYANEVGVPAQYVSYKIIDTAQFTKDVIIALEIEAEDGTTAIHTLLDNAFVHAIENGSFGVANAATETTEWQRIHK